VPPRGRSEWFNNAYDVAAIRMRPNAKGQNVADAVGGGVEIALNRPRDQRHQILGYPGGHQQGMHQCEARYFGDDRLFFSLEGRPPFGVGCHMGNGTGGGPFLIEAGTMIDGLVSYSRPNVTTRSYNPCFSKHLLGPPIAGLQSARMTRRRPPRPHYAARVPIAFASVAGEKAARAVDERMPGG
jgi:hypothetical protein